jgi:hypothetical protein
MIVAARIVTPIARVATCSVPRRASEVARALTRSGSVSSSPIIGCSNTRALTNKPARRKGLRLRAIVERMVCKRRGGTDR